MEEVRVKSGLKQRSTLALHWLAVSGGQRSRKKRKKKERIEEEGTNEGKEGRQPKGTGI